MVTNDMHRWDFDRHVFKLILGLTSIFMTAYVLGISVPYWFFLHESVENFSRCISSHNYIDYSSIRNDKNYTEVEDKEVMLTVKSSLWYLYINVRNNDEEISTFMTFRSIRSSPYTKQEGLISVNEKLLVTTEQPNNLTYLMLFSLLAFGLIFGWRASMKPSRRIFYGISVICIVLGTTVWINVAMQTGTYNVMLVAVGHCSVHGQIMTSPFLHVLMGSMGILSLVFGFLLIHLSTLTSLYIHDYAKEYPYKIGMNQYSGEDNIVKIDLKNILANLS